MGVDLALDAPSPRPRGGTARLLGALIENGLRPQHFAAAIALVRELDWPAESASRTKRPESPQAAHSVGA
jgi:hypothetical protein